jgi:hypothetical protein
MMVLCSCGPVDSLQRAQLASDARQKMIGMPKEQVLACMGVPVRRATEGTTEVWMYTADSGTVDVAASAGGASISQGYCDVSVVFTDGKIIRLNYSDHNDGMLTPGAQCAYAVRGCMQ